MRCPNLTRSSYIVRFSSASKFGHAIGAAVAKDEGGNVEEGLADMKYYIGVDTHSAAYVLRGYSTKHLFSNATPKLYW
jgi:hypothetical protein